MGSTNVHITGGALRCRLEQTHPNSELRLIAVLVPLLQDLGSTTESQLVDAAMDQTEEMRMGITKH